MTLLVTYPHDPSAVKDVCLIKNEYHVINTIDNDYRVIVPELAPFFKLDLKIVHMTSGLVLAETKDYNLGYRLLDAAKIANRELFGAIVITNTSLQGEFSIQYRTVGGNYVGIRSEVLTYLANMLVDPVKVYFENIIDRPSYYTPYMHEQHYSDFVAKEGVATALDGIANAITTATNNVASAGVADLVAKINALDTYLTSIRYDLHIINKSNPHATTAAQVNALGKNDSSVDAFKAYSKTIMELAAYVNSRGIVQADIDKYLHKSTNETYSNNLILKDDVAVIKSSSGTTEIDLSGGNIKVTSDLMSVMTVDSNVNTVGKAAVLKSGKNILQITSSGANGFDVTKLTFNGHEVLNTNNALRMLEGTNAGGMKVLTENTATVTWTGDSRPGTELKATATLPASTTSVSGTTKLSNDKTVGGVTTSPTPFVINEIRELLLAKLDNTIKINGYSLGSNPVLTKADIDLGAVDNTTDANKPVSTAQAALLDKYSLIAHDHKSDTVAAAIASATDKGIMRLISNFDEIDFIGAAATPKLLALLEANMADADTGGAGLLSDDVLDVRYWSTYDDVTCSGVVLTFPAGVDLYMQKVDYGFDLNIENEEQVLDLKVAFPNNYANKTFYIYVTVVNDAIGYFASEDKLSNVGLQLHVATIKTSATGILDMRTVNSGVNIYDNNISGILDVEPVTSVGMFRELLEHVEDPLAHVNYLASVDSNTIGLDLLNNYPASVHKTESSHHGTKYWDILAMFASSNATITSTPLTVANGTVDVNQGVELTLPITSTTNKLILLRNRNFGFNDPDRAELQSNGTKIRFVEYMVNPTVANTFSSVEQWSVVLGSYIDESGNVHDIVFIPAHGKGSTTLGFSLTYYVNGIASSVLVSKVVSTYVLPASYSAVSISMQYSKTTEGFQYIAKISYLGDLGNSEYSATIDFTDTGFTVEYKLYITATTAASNTGNSVSTVSATYKNDAVKNTFLSGTIGLGGVLTTIGTANTFKMSIDCRSNIEAGQDKRYVTAAAVQQSLKDGCNVMVAKGVLAAGAIMPTLYNASRAYVYTGLTQLGATTEDSKPIGLFTMKYGKVQQKLTDETNYYDIASSYMIVGLETCKKTMRWV